MISLRTLLYKLPMCDFPLAKGGPSCNVHVGDRLYSPDYLPDGNNYELNGPLAKYCQLYNSHVKSEPSLSSFN